jgi:ubiquinone biosynthesis monooxygenase Coq6
VSTIPGPAAILIMPEIGAWEHVDVERTSPIEDMQVLSPLYSYCLLPLMMCQVWDGISDARIDFNAAALGIGRGDGRGQMARLTETLNLQRGLLRNLREQPNFTIRDNTKVENIFDDDIPGGGWPTVQLSNGTALRARLLVCFIPFLRMTD